MKFKMIAFGLLTVFISNLSYLAAHGGNHGGGHHDGGHHDYHGGGWDHHYNDHDWHQNHYHNNVYVNDPWYTPQFTYYDTSYANPYYYNGSPYYYYHPAYYWGNGVNVNLSIN